MYNECIFSLEKIECFFPNIFMTSSYTSLHIRNYTVNCLFRAICRIKVKFVQILMHLITNIFNLSLTRFRRLETSSRPFHDFDKMTAYCNLVIFSRCLHFFDWVISQLQKSSKPNSS